MSVFSDTRLTSLQRDLKVGLEDQQRYTAEITRLRTRMDGDIRKIRESFERDIDGNQNKYDAISRKILDITRQIETRQEELDRDSKREQAEAARASTAAGQKKSSW